MVTYLSDDQLNNLNTEELRKAYQNLREAHKEFVAEEERLGRFRFSENFADEAYLDAVELFERAKKKRLSWKRPNISAMRSFLTKLNLIYTVKEKREDGKGTLNFYNLFELQSIHESDENAKTNLMQKAKFAHDVKINWLRFLRIYVHGR